MLRTFNSSKLLVFRSFPPNGLTFMEACLSEPSLISVFCEAKNKPTEKKGESTVKAERKGPKVLVFCSVFCFRFTARNIYLV